MYSYTQIGDAPVLLVRCKCSREYIQEEIYTCLGCSAYACRYCTTVELSTFYCRNCSEIVSENECTKLYRCQKCYSCPCCSHVLTVSKDPKFKYSNCDVGSTSCSASFATGTPKRSTSPTKSLKSCSR